MTARPAFHTPRATEDPRRFRLPVGADACVGPAARPFLMGGVGLGSAIGALEHATGRPLIWATAQYLSFAAPGSVVDIGVHVPVAGKSITQARVVSRVGDTEILAVSAALGSREGYPLEQYSEMPNVPRPEACEPTKPEFASPGDLHHRLDRRGVVDEAAEKRGVARTWIRTLDGAPVTAGVLAIFADFLPGAIAPTRRSSSLDNTLRIRRLPPDTRWCLLDTRMAGLASGFFHGEMSIFAEDGTLLATASQSGALPRPA